MDNSPKGLFILWKEKLLTGCGLCLHQGDKEFRYGPLRMAIIDNTRSRFVFIFGSEQGPSNKLAVPSKNISELLFWPRHQLLDQ